MLPAHPQFQHDEIFSSWMVRLAFANSYPLHTFYTQVLGCESPIWNRDVDRHPQALLIRVLSRQTGQPPRALLAHSLAYYEGLVYACLPAMGQAPWVRPAGIFHRDRRHPGMQYCPLCLADGPVPYFRLRWRLAFYGLCHVHGTCMQDRCAVCDAPVMFHRHGIGKDKPLPYAALYLCGRCGADLRDAPAEAPSWKDPGSLRSYIDVCQLFSHHGWACGEHVPPVPVPFFDGLHVLVSAITGRHGKLVRALLADELAMDFNGMVPDLEFEQRSSEEQRYLMLATLWLLQDWPDRFVHIFRAGQFGRSRLQTVSAHFPFWLASVVDTALDGRHYQPSIEELAHGVDYLRREGQTVCATNLCRLFGQTADSQSLLWRAWTQNTDASGRGH